MREPPTFDGEDAATAAGHWLFSGPVTFELSVAQLGQLPGDDLPEIAFAGRSNVGKSSLINALTRRSALARTSVTPGRTQMLNLFALGAPAQLRLVDMPGYGFAKAPPKVVAQWQRLVRSYLKGRANLKRVFVLIDARHGLKPPDLDMLDMLDAAAVSYQLVLTKADKLTDKGTHAAAQLARDIAARPAAYPDILLTSAERQLGLEAARAAAASLLPQLH